MMPWKSVPSYATVMLAGLWFERVYLVMVMGNNATVISADPCIHAVYWVIYKTHEDL